MRRRTRCSTTSRTSRREPALHPARRRCGARDHLARSPHLNLSVAVQHHPSRAHLLPRLEGLGEFEVVTDPEPDAPIKAPIRTYLHALRTPPPGATHRLVVQDDAVPGESLLTRFLPLLAERPEHLIALFVPGRTILRRMMGEAHERGERWLSFPAYNWCPTVALCWPVEHGHDFVGFAEAVIETRRRRGLETIGDDPWVGSWRKQRKVEVSCTVPCLVEHPDDQPSLFRDYGAKNGRNRARVAALYVG